LVRREQLRRSGPGEAEDERRQLDEPSASDDRVDPAGGEAGERHEQQEGEVELTHGRTRSLLTDLGPDLRDRLAHGDVATLAAATVLDLDLAVDQSAPDDDDGWDADELGVLELHARADASAIVVEHLDSAGLELAGELLAIGEEVVTLAGRHDVDIGRREGTRPDQAELVVVALRDAGHRA